MQAHRIKSDPPATREGVLHFVHGVLREIGFWLLVAVASGMMTALATFSPDDPAWTHTANVDQWRNLGGVIGAWFADITLYFFGYPAYLLPLGVAFGGWRLFRRGALLKLDGEIVLLRVLGFVVTLTMACGLIAPRLHPWPGTLPSAVESAGGLVGLNVSQFLIHAFEFAGGNLFMLALLLAGVTLTTGFSWLIVLDWIGQAALKGFDWVGSLVMAPIRRMYQKPLTDHTDDTVVESTAEVAPAAHAETATTTTIKANPVPGFFQQAIAWPQAWWQTRQPDARLAKTAVAAESSSLILVPVAVDPAPVAATDANEAPTGWHSARIEPIWNPGLNQEPSLHPEPSAADPAAIISADREPPAGLEMLTLVPRVAPAVCATPPVASSVASPLTDPDSDQGKIRPPAASPKLAKTAVTAQRTPSTPAASCRLPSLNLLDNPSADAARSSSRESLEPMSRRVEILLKHFGIAAKVVATEPGPVITVFEIDPAPGVDAGPIHHRTHDLARGLSVSSVRVIETIPGKSTIRLEIPNPHHEVIALRAVLAAPAYTQSLSPLTLALGQDIGGNPVVANLAKMPHLLMAGSAGSGVSAAIHTLLLSLLYKASPSEARLILVDLTMLEQSLFLYEEIPHLLTPVISDIGEAVNALRWCISEMERRYRLMAALKVRNIAGFNRKVADGRTAGKDLAEPLWKPGDHNGIASEAPLLPLPLIVMVITELAEMMTAVGQEVEEQIARLAQKAQAAGIHLILATEHPSATVITGLIKANIPARIAFQVSSQADSFIILDQSGAEQLLGHGDMLYLPASASGPQRAHGASVYDHEVIRVVDYLRQTPRPNDSTADFRPTLMAGDH